jgi:hypothetical protein
MVHIFLSHNARDRDSCASLKASAAELDIKAYLAEHDVCPGANLAEKVHARSTAATRSLH